MNSAPGLLGISPGASKDERKQAVMREIQQQQNIQNAQMLIEKVNENCFEKCVPKPGSSLSNGESACMTNCMQKYLQAWNTVSSALITRVKTDPQAAS